MRPIVGARYLRSRRAAGVGYILALASGVVASSLVTGGLAAQAAGLEPTSAPTSAPPSVPASVPGSPDPTSAPTSSLPSESPTQTERPIASCTARYKVISKWRGGFLVRVNITNTGSREVLWAASWTWTHGERLKEAYNAVAEGTETSPRLHGTVWNMLVKPDESVSVFLRASGRPRKPAPEVYCSAVA